mmetsp:Transcript_127163/g.365730  ORF Transcript_127163/g.365730 Transcript_127163/m.365730 type:complete len:352 (-) Transcript_127163:432-1487(-)
MAAVREAVAAALASLMLAVGIACLPLGIFGPLLSGVAAATSNWIAMRRMWRSRCVGFFGVVEAKHRAALDKLYEALEFARKQVMSIVVRVEEILDKLIDEQRPNLAHFEKHADRLKMAKPDFEVPDPKDLKKPLEVVQDLIDGFLDDAKTLVPKKMQEQVSSTFAGRLSSEWPLFELWALRLPVYIALLVNLTVVVVQWVVFLVNRGESTPAVIDTQATKPPGNQSAWPVHGASSYSVPEVDVTFEHWKAVLGPAIVQIALALVQQAAAVAFAAVPRICSFVNDHIAAGEGRANEEANARVKAVVGKIVEGALAAVRKAADAFFPKFEECVQQLKPVLETSAKAAALAKGC